MAITGFPLIFLSAVFVIGYLLLIFEFYVKVNKTAIALLLAVVSWGIYFLTSSLPMPKNLFLLEEHLGSAAQILFFLMGAMTIVELIDSHKGFKVISDCIRTSSKRRLLWTFSLLTFFLSAALDNLATAILMVTLLRKLIPEEKERFLPACFIVIAANAGGAWTPMGDITTTMLWIGGQISSWAIIKALFIPSLVSLLVPLIYYSLKEKGKYTHLALKESREEPGGRLVFILGIGLLVFVPLFKAVTGLPPFVGVLFGLGVLWLITDLLHYKFEERHHLRVPFVLTKIDTSSILFFLGILLTMDALETAGILNSIASWINTFVHNAMGLATLLGIISAILDNVPLVAALMGMYPLTDCPMDARFWHLVAYAAGTGGSLLLIGSAAGIAVMGMEKINFLSYLKRATFPIFLGFLAGIGAYLVFS